MPKYEVDSVEINTGRLLTSIVIAESPKFALMFEKQYFGEPFFRILRARPLINKKDWYNGISHKCSDKSV